MNKARVERGKYKCNLCSGIFPRKEITLDHKNPVVQPEVGFVDFDTYIERMFVDEDGFQVLCNKCHDKKTAEERLIRKQSYSRKKS